MSMGVGPLDFAEVYSRQTNTSIGPITVPTQNPTRGTQQDSKLCCADSGSMLDSELGGSGSMLDSDHGAQLDSNSESEDGVDA